MEIRTLTDLFKKGAAKQNLSDNKAAAALGYPQPTYHRIVKGSKRLTYEDAMKALYFGWDRDLVLRLYRDERGRAGIKEDAQRALLEERWDTLDELTMLLKVA